MKHTLKEWKGSGLSLPEWFVLLAVSAAAFLFLYHPDIHETANHSWVFLDSLFAGKGMEFYQIVADHQNPLYYVNHAHYNILIYLLFGLWELPVWLVCKVGGLAVNEMFLTLWAKGLSVLFFVGCGWQLRSIAQKLELRQPVMAALLFWFYPLSLQSAVNMGQYDTICLFFLLWSLRYYLDGRLGMFSFVMGVGVVCKFFPLLVYIPLLLLAEKRLLPLVRYAATTLWLLIPTSLLFHGRTGNASFFTGLMIDRIFELKLDTGMGGASLFLAMYALLVFGAYLYRPAGRKARERAAVYCGLFVFASLFLCICWHPQWLILLTPFVVLSTLQQEQRGPWFYLDVILNAGFIWTGYLHYGSHVGAQMVSSGILGRWVAAPERHVAYFMGLVPYLVPLVPVMLAGAVLAQLVFKMPVGERSLADRLTREESEPDMGPRPGLWLVFGAGYMGCWLLPMLLELLNGTGVL